MVSELDALRTIADQLIQSDPLQVESWDKDLSPCLPIAQAHLHAWSLDIQNRGNPNGLFVMDTKLEIMGVRKLRNETQAINKSTNSLSNACAEIFLSRTSAPFYHGEPNAYPFLSSNEKQVTSRAKDLWTYMRESSGSLQRSVKEDYNFMRHYFSVPVRVELFVKSGLVNERDASNMISKVYPHGITIPVFQRGNPAIQTGLGVELHALGDPGDKLQLAAIACRGAFHAAFTWDRFNSVLVQGGWPWLRGYSKAYAKMVYTVMVLIFAAFENYQFNDRAEMHTRILALAGKLVGNPAGGHSPWTVRRSVYLKGPKVTARARLHPRHMNGQGIADNSTTQTNGAAPSSAKAGPVLDDTPWTYTSQSSVPFSKQLPSHVVIGTACNHHEEDIFSGRVKLAHSISDVGSITSVGNEITVAMTASDERARHEVWEWVIQRGMMTVQRKKGQCLGCAVRAAHCVAALVVVV